MRVLHVANGTSTTNVIVAAAIPGRRSIWADPLYEGPVPGGLSDDELIAVRAQYLAGSSDAPVDPINDLREWRRAIDAHESYDELVLWFEHDLFDQLNVIQLLSWIRDRGAASKIVSLVCIGSFPGRPDFKGLGELSASELAPIFDARRPVVQSQYDLAERAWAAFREASPLALDALRRSDTAALPYLAPALERFLQEYPSRTDGLSRSERRILEVASAGPITLAAAFPRMHEGESAYYVTDLSFPALVATLSRTSPALLSVEGGVDRHWRTTSISLTAAGAEALNGRRDRVACGLDRWLGGVHLRDGTPLWRWDERRGAIVRG